MISGKFFSAILLFALFQSFSSQVVLNRALLQQWLGTAIDNKAYYLNQKGIKDIDPNTFNGLTHVEELYMSNNQLKSVENYMFKELKSLQILVLEFNSIGSIAPDAFTGMTSLRDLYFHRNQVNFISFF
jgi:Leucine-rich repeat (LRR) protein